MRCIYRKGPVTLRSYPVASASVVNLGDAVYMDTTAKANGDYTWDTNLATTQGTHAAVFIGIAHTASASGETDNIQVNVNPETVYEVDCASATFLPGALVGFAKQSGNLLEPQKVAAAISTSSVGRVETGVTSATRVRVTFASAYHTASSNVNANVG